MIVATPYQGRHPIDHRDFWNICGRAGRAFVDGEGKILYALDETDKAGKVKRNRRLAEKYFDTANADPVESGLLFALHIIRDIAKKAGVDFDQLMTMVCRRRLFRVGQGRMSGVLGFSISLTMVYWHSRKTRKQNPGNEGA